MSFETMTMRQIYDLFYDIPCDVIDHPNNCNHDWIITESAYTCRLCGVVDIHRIIYEKSACRNRKNYHLYHRIMYFREKLKLLTGHKQSQSPKYNDIVKSLKEYEIKDIYQLKKILKSNGHSKFYKYIYSIYRDIKGVQLITLSLSDIGFLESKFLILERQFKLFLKERSNFLNYNMTIYILLKQNNYECHKHIILPKNQKKLVDKFSRIIENY